MAGKSAQEPTEQPTPEKIRKAREDGTIPQSKELPSGLMLVLLLLALAMFARRMHQFFVSHATAALAPAPGRIGTLAGYTHLLQTVLVESMIVLAPFLIAATLSAVLGGLLMGGRPASPKAARFRLDPINPVSGLRNILSLQSVVTLLVGLGKLAVLGGIAWYYLHDKIDDCMALRWQTAEGILGGMAGMVFGLVARVAVGIVAIALLDCLYQRWSYKRRLRMTKQEVRQERKDREMSPGLKGRVRRIQIEMARKRMLQRVPEADVVLVNPTHVAVALQYNADTNEAPVVVAKGPDLLAAKIKEIAGANQIPIVQRPELARAIYQTVEVDQPIPEALFVAVAEVLAMIYRARSRSASSAPRSTT